jgi:hypothetical protein
MEHVHTKIPNRAVNQRKSAGKQAYESRDYFGEALRILDNDMTLDPQREHLVTLWGLVTGLTRRLTQALVECQEHRESTTRQYHRDTGGLVDVHIKGACDGTT